MKQYAAVHQFHSGASPGDAVTNQMLHVQAHLHQMGIESEIFGEHIDPRIAHQIRSIHGYDGSETELLLVHHSMGNDVFDEVVGLPNDLVAVYHNITPVEYFTDPTVRHYARLGREQLAMLARRARVGIAVSNYNRREMQAVGFRRVEVLPVRTDFSEFAVGPAYDPVEERRSRDWLFVGRVVGNKCQHELVRAFAAYSKTFGPDARLVLVGDLSMADYVAQVRAEAVRLGIADRVVLLGKVSAGQLRSALAGAGMFVSMSEHEGFGVPILEAMAAGVPVVAFAAAAVPETMGGAGVLLRTKDPAVVAATVQAVQADPDLRRRLVARQLSRVEQVQAFDAPALLERVIRRAAGADQPLEVQVQGPFETSYSLAVMNRELALGLDRRPELAVSIYATEGPGDYEPRQQDMDSVPRATELFHRSRSVPYPHVVIRQMYPPRVIDTPGGITCEYFGWEESRIPESMAEDFNRYLDGIGVMSAFVRDVLRDSGVDVPVRVVGNGVKPHDPAATVSAVELEGLRGFRFLNISSAFPRKGVDVLLEAYFAEFDGGDDVTLVLKSFPNPHNDVGDLLKRLRAEHPNPPDVRWIDRDLDDVELQGLYNLASCYVHPARGEGFGLPVAEAMAAGVPVISVAYSGLSDFVTPDTAVTIPFRLEAARTHFEIPGSIWAEPERDRLAEEMRRIFDEPTAAEVRERTGRARELMRTRFSWEAAVARWASFLEDLENWAETARVAMVSTWNSRCGIAENTRSIVDHLGESVVVDVFANDVPDIIDPLREPGVVRCWSDRWRPELDQLEEALRLSDADVVHVQFNFGFFELGRLAGLLERQLDQRGVVVSLHRTADIEVDGKLLSLSEIRPTLERVDRVIVHQESDVHNLAAMGIAANVVVVPLGADPPPPVSPVDVRKALGLGTRPIVATFGFLLPHKGTLELIGVVDALRREFPDLCLLALCSRHAGTEGFEDEVRAAIAGRGLEDNVILVSDYLPDDTARAILRSADAIVLPYRETAESSSAALRFVLPIERPIVATDLAIFADAGDSLLTVDPSDPTGIEDAVRRVLVDAELQADLAGRAARAARRFRWQRVAADHREIYAAARGAHRRRVTPA